MKVERTNKDFQPIELSITIETKAELHDLYARMLLSGMIINDHLQMNYKAMDDNYDNELLSYLVDII
jgi:hypothetical protein|tara:strand:- start:332 stop:532 length:201 start_codon:yes stop_codon:yes gene_type:complete